MKNIFPLLFLVLTGFAAWAQQTDPHDSIYDMQDSVLIKIREGTSISAIIVRKKGNTQPLPAILFYTTYYQGPGDAIFAKKSADRDYVGIVAYSRGIRTNLADYAPYEHDGKDVYDVIDWIIKQPWSNGKVGMYGGSYTGFVQWATTKHVHPALKTIVPQVAVMPGFDTPMENNIPYPPILIWSNDNIYRNEPLPQDLPFIWYEKGTSYRSLDSLAGKPNPIFQKWLQHPDYDEYWRSMVPTPEEYAKIDIPILTTTGYYDGAQIGALQYFKLHHKYHKNPAHYLVIGPYDHWSGQRKAGPNLMGYAIDTVADMDMQELAYQWFDYILKDAKKPEILKDKINFEVMGANQWRHVTSLKDINTDTLTFYLSNHTIETDYALTTQKPEKEQFVAQTVDFADRTAEGQHNYFTPFIINDTINPSNGLIYTTPPFEEAFSINGSFMGNLTTSINKKDMDVSIALYELMPDGKYFYLTRYLGRSSYAKDNTKRQLLKPNKKEIIPFGNTRFISKKINKGSRLVIILNINKHPFEVMNYGTGKDVNDETMYDANEPLHIKWYTDSFIKVPIWKE